MAGKRTRQEFENVMLPHLASAHAFALWLLRHPHDAEDAVQEAYLRAFKSFNKWSGENAAAWLMTIVRNTCMTRLRSRARHSNVVHLDSLSSDGEGSGFGVVLVDEAPLPDAILAASAEQRMVRRAIGRLPFDFREVIILREFDAFSYKQIADITGVPIGTVMSRLSRARRQLRDFLSKPEKGGRTREM